MEAKRVARAGVMAALLAVSAQVMVPIGPVPFTLQTLVLAMVPAVLDPATSVFTVLAYVMLGAVGLPIFAGFNGGIGALAGPTGGFCGALSWAARWRARWQKCLMAGSGRIRVRSRARPRSCSFRMCAEPSSSWHS